MSAPSSAIAPRDQAGGQLRRVAAWLATPAGLAALFGVGLVIRLICARGGGFPFDMSSFAGWAGRLAERGPWDFYPTEGSDRFFVDYPPGYLYVLWIVGLFSKIVLGGTPPVFLLKIPPILGDLVLAWLVMNAAPRLAPGGVVARRAHLKPLAAAAILLNPAIFFISAVWGQADSVPAALVVGSLMLLGTGTPTFRREAGGIALLAIAIGTKPQTGFVLPVVLLLLVWRHVRGRAVAVDDDYRKRRATWTGVGRVVALGLVGVIAGFALFAPFRLDPVRAFEFYRHASQTYQVTSVFAFNIWGAVGFWRADVGRDAVTFLGVPAVVIGMVLFVVAGALVVWRAWRSLQDGQDEGRVLVFGSIAMTLVGFAVVTRIHERYLFVPIALAAMMVGTRWVRRAMYALSALYFINVFFPYVYYLRYVKRPAPDLGGLFDAFYGTDLTGVQLRTLSAITGIACLAIAWRGWRALETAPPIIAGPPEVVVTAPLPDADKKVRRRWTLDLHPIGRRRGLIALGVFAIALISRLAGLGHPPGMYFDEVYHARTGAEYLGSKEVFEYTHPPFAKEVMGFATQHLSGIATIGGAPLPAGVEASTVVPRPDGVAWVRDERASSVIELGVIDASCGLERTSGGFASDASITAVAVTPSGAVLAAGSSDGEFIVQHIVDRRETWRANLPSEPAKIAALDERAYVITTTGDLVTISPDGEPDTLAVGARSLSTSSSDDDAWVTFPDEKRIAKWDEAGKRGSVIEVQGEMGDIAAAPDGDRLFLVVGDEIRSYETENDAIHERIAGHADALGVIPETTAVWAVSGRGLRVIEPHSGVVIGSTAFERAPDIVTADTKDHRLVGISDDSLQCASAHPQFAWRLGSAIAGAAMVALVFLLALRLTGNLLVGLLGALFLAVDGIAFTLARIAMNDSYVTAFVLGAWFCMLSALRTWGRDVGGAPPRRLATIAWLAAGGVCAGLGLASKWVALYALVGIGIVALWDAFSRGDRSIWRAGGGPVTGIAVLGLLFGILPIAIYVLTYIPYFQLGHGASDFFKLQGDMYSYHATLTATHPFGSPWYGWPFGYRAVFLYLDGTGAERAEMWTIGNVVVLWGGLVAMFVAAFRAWRLRAGAIGLIILGALVQYLPWIAVTRVTFMYHYLPVIPFLALGLAWLLVIGLRDTAWHKPLLVAVPAAAVVVFLLTYPMLVGWDMPTTYLDAVRSALPWVIP